MSTPTPHLIVVGGRCRWLFPDGRTLPVVAGGDHNASSIADLCEQRAQAARQSAETIIRTAATENRAFTSAEQEAFDAATAEVEQLSRAAATYRQNPASGAPGAPGGPPQIPTGQGGGVVRSEPQTYNKGGQFSHAADIALRALGRHTPQTLERLERHAREVDVETRAGSTADGSGGEFTPPLWVLSEYVAAMRPGRAVVDLARRLGLPAGTDSLNVPSITTGTLTAVQATENSAITTRDMVTASTTADVTTVAGYYDCSLQQLEQSAVAGGWDQIVYTDLLADMDMQLDTLAMYGTGANNQPVGLFTAAFTTVTVTTQAATALYGGIADGQNRIATNRYLPPQVIIMAPRRWFWLVSRYDDNGRPLVVPDAQAGQNLIAAMGVSGRVQGVVGVMQGLPVVIDATVSTTTSTYFDDVAVGRPSDWILWEGTPRLEAFRDVLSSTLGVRLRAYEFAAFTTRTGRSVAKLTGAGLTGPTW